MNKAEKALQSSRKFKVLDFEKLVGLDALIKTAIKHTDKKARELVQELLINVYLKQAESKRELIYQFVDICMKSIQNAEESDGVVPLLSQFLDRYEGVREPKIDFELQSRHKAFRSIQVTNMMDPLAPVQKIFNLYYYQSLGFLRKEIAKEYSLAPAEFHIVLKSQMILDPETDDDKFMRDLAGQFQPYVTIRRNEAYVPEDHPKLYLSQKAENFEAIFTLLKIAPVNQLDKIYSLFTKLPVNPALLNKFKSLDSVRNAPSEELKSKAWEELLDPSCFYHLLFCLSILSGLVQKDP